jgi:hypothetical protein
MRAHERVSTIRVSGWDQTVSTIRVSGWINGLGEDTLDPSPDGMDLIANA